jgi:hypothetical protein
MRWHLSLLLLLIVAAGCTGWHAQTSPAPEIVARQQGRGVLRIARKDGSVLELRSPRVMGDSIVGIGGSPPRRTGVALADVERIQRRGFSASRTGGLVLGYFAFATIVAFGVALGAWAGHGLD